MASYTQDQSFRDTVKEDVTAEIIVSTSILDTAISWISKNLNPQEVFDENELAEWATNNGYKLQDE